VKMPITRAPAANGEQVKLTQTIADQVDAMTKESGAALPEGIAEIFAREQQHLRGVTPGSGIALGALVEDVPLLDIDGASTTLNAIVGNRTTVLVFYRGAWCPYCNLTLRAYERDLVPALADRDIGVVAVSPQLPDGSRGAAENNALSFTVVSDPGNRLAGQFGILTAPSEEAQEAQKQLGLDLTAVNADGTTGLPMPSTVIVDGHGALRWRDVHPDYTTRSEVHDILGALDDLGR
jgi:peroxiredoxin